MKILHLMTHLDSGGIGRYILSLCAPLKTRGVEVHVASSEGALVPEFREAGACLHLGFPRVKVELDPRLYLSLPRLLELLRKEKIDIMHAHNRASQVLAHWASGLSAVPYVTTCHGFYKRRLGRRIWPAWGARVIAISDDVARHLHEDFHVPPSAVRTVENGVDIDGIRSAVARFSPAEAKAFFGIPEEAMVIGCIARLVKVKGQGDLIQAFKRVKETHSGIHLLLAGDGKDRAYFEALARESGVNSSITFTGNLDEVARALAAIDVFALPATWREAFGLSILEAMAAGKPVIVSDNWALASAFKEKTDALLVPPGDPIRLAEELSRLVSDRVLREKIGKEGAMKASRLYSLDRMADGILRVYKETLTPQTS